MVQVKCLIIYIFIIIFPAVVFAEARILNAEHPLLTENNTDSVSYPDILKSHNSFSQWFRSKTDFECQENPRLAALMAPQIEKIIFKGLRSIYKINSYLVIYRLFENRNRKVKFSCIKADPSRDWDGMYVPFSLYFDGFSLKTNLGGSLILIPINIIDGIEMMKVKLEDNSYPLKFDFGDIYFDKYKGTKNTILHEYLHFLGFDSADKDYHRSVGKKDVRIRKDNDLVYTCAEFAYPSWSLEIQEGEMKMSLSKSCYLCAMAVIKKGRNLIDANRGQYAAKRCSALDRLEYGMKKAGELM